MRFPLVALALLAPAPAAALDCPIPPNVVETQLEAAPSCRDAVDLFRACLAGSGADVSRGEVVRERCERDFLAGAPRERKRAYDREVAGCERKYAHRSGTLYRSLAADCAVGVAARFSAQAVRGRTPTANQAPNFDWIPRSARE